MVLAARRLATHVAQAIGEAGVGRVDVQQPCVAGPRLRERVLDAGRRGDERAWPAEERPAVDGELDLALEDVERVGVVGVRVQLRPLELPVEVELEDREVGQIGLDERRARAARQPLALAWA